MILVIKFTINIKQLILNKMSKVYLKWNFWQNGVISLLILKYLHR